MQLTSLFKGTALVVSFLALAACSNTPEETAVKTETTAPVVEEVQEEVSTGLVEPVIEVDPEAEKAAMIAALQEYLVLYFDFDKSEIRPEFTDLLDKHADFLRTVPTASVLIEGHADERGTPEYNIALGERRAKAVARYLQSMGVQESQITIVSYGEEKPVDTSHTEAAFSLNRRAVLVY